MQIIINNDKTSLLIEIIKQIFKEIATNDGIETMPQ